MTLLVRNEEDILAENIEYHLNQGVDFIIATNNRSTDSTGQILKRYESKGLLHYLEEEDDTHNQGRWVTNMARIAASEFKADWVINNDADEFWWPTEHSSLKAAFSAVTPEFNVVEAKRNNFVYLGAQLENNRFYKHLIYRELNSLNPLGKPLPPKQAHIGQANILVAEGNHSVKGLEKQQINRDIIEIFHFPIRSPEQLTRKILYGGAALERNTDITKNTGSTWRNLYQQLLDAGDLSHYLDSQTFGSAKLQRQLKDGLVLEDVRLKCYLDKLVNLQ